jgi:diguanylate cyclase (GGDEF)-like protein
MLFRRKMMIHSNDPKNVALRIAAVYMLAGALWILVSDKVAGIFVKNNETMTFISMIKGWTYVAATGILIFALVLKALKRAKTAENELLHKNRDLVSAKDEIALTCEKLAASEAIYRQQFEDSRKNQNQLKESELKYKLLTEAMHDLAYYDQLTGLKNRASLIDRMSEVLNRNNKIRCALLFIDLDNFKYINDTMGHSFGDRMLKQISNRLLTLVENRFNVYRLGGDEFIILAEDYSELGEIERISVKILKELKNRIEIDNCILFNTVSIGVSLFPEHGYTMDELLMKADIAVYKAKDAGKNRIVIYDEPMNEAVTERMNIERGLRVALENNEFELYFQPQLDLQTNRISGFEALLRWHSDELGFVSPVKFISIAEDTHMIIPIGEWVIRNACIFLKRMHQTGYKDLTVSVNVSMLQLLQADFADFVSETLEMSYLEPKDLELEITESILMESYEAIAGKLMILRERGIKIALDDFGKGYSSLNYLRHLPISTLKIDKTFIDTISSTEKNRSLTDMIVKIGKSMDLCVVAEGVETQEQLDYLKKHKCSKIQGYLFSRPLTEADALNKLTV